MDNKDNMTIEQLEKLAQAYFDCELSRREEEEFKAVLLFAGAHSPLIDECRLAMGLEVIAARPLASAQTRRRRKYRYWYAAAACLAAIIIAGVAIMVTSSGQLQDNQETVITVYANGKQITDKEQACGIAMARYNECIAMAKALEDNADKCLEHANALEQLGSDAYRRAALIQSQAAATEASIIDKINKYTASNNAIK